MEVTRDNFREARLEFLTHLRDTDFISFSLCVTGNHSEEKSPTDFGFEHYLKTYHTCNTSSILKLGICLFKCTPDSEIDESVPVYAQEISEFEAYAFDFYLFPGSYNGVASRDIGFEVASIEQLVFKEGIDWNKWLEKGVWYCDQDERNRLEAKIIGKKSGLLPLLNEQEREEADDEMDRFGEWYNDDTNVKENLLGVMENQLHNDPLAFVIHDIALRVKRVVRSEISKFDPALFIQSIFNPLTRQDDYKVLKLSNKGRKDALNAESKIRQLHYRDAIGFSHIWERIKQKLQSGNIPVVGCDALLQLGFWYAHLEGYLTKDYEWFKREIYRVFAGGVYDIKAMSSLLEQEWKKTQRAHRELLELGGHSVSLPQANLDCTKQEQKNTSAFEAYRIGFSFLQICKNVELKSLMEFKSLIKLSPGTLFHIDLKNPHFDYIRNQKIWAFVLSRKQGNLFRVKNGCIDKKGKLIPSTLSLYKFIFFVYSINFGFQQN